jgi:hypothetical protein
MFVGVDGDLHPVPQPELGENAGDVALDLVGDDGCVLVSPVQARHGSRAVLRIGRQLRGHLAPFGMGTPLTALACAVFISASHWARCAAVVQGALLSADPHAATASRPSSPPSSISP